MLIRREDFGNLNDLNPNSRKKVWFTCEICGAGVLRRYNLYLKYEKRCLSCRSKAVNKKTIDINRKSQLERWKYVDRKNAGKKISEGQKKSWAKNKYRKSRKPVDFNIIKESFEKEGYKVLTTDNEYVSASKTKIKFKCPNEHEHEISWEHWKRGQRCSYCSGKISYTKKYNEIYSKFLERDCLLLTKDIPNARTQVEFICPKGHISSIMLDNFLHGHGCSECAGNKKLTVDYDNFKEDLEKFGFTLTNKIISNPDDDIEISCSRNHIFNTTYRKWKLGSKECPICNNYTSKQEREIRTYIESLGVAFSTNVRSIIPPLELDIVIPSLKIAIEYNGLYWHSETRLKDKKYHLKKLERCQEEGYRLIQIFEDEWINRQDIVKNRLRHILYKTKPIYARKCIIKEIDTKTASNFVNKTHIQGYTGSSVKLGAFYNDEIVAVMTFAKLSISKGSKNKDNQWELSRFCCSVPIVGIASKMLEYFKRNFSWNKIISYSDRRWNTGNLYESIGFKFTSYTKPNYWYFKIGESKRYHRFNFRKDKLIGEGTEWEIMQKNGYDRIWDCGNAKYVIKQS